MLAADGVFRANDTFVSLPPVPEDLLSQGFRQAVLEFLVTERAIAEEPCTHILDAPRQCEHDAKICV